MAKVAISEVSLPLEATLLDALRCIDRSGVHAALIIDEAGSLAGMLTDGDVRRAILNGAALSTAALPHATTHPQTVTVGSSRAAVLDLMRALWISAVPEVDGDRRPLGLHTLSAVVGAQELPNPAVIMAGGRGSRLGALTRSVPKPLMEVAGRSILEWILLNLVGGGIRKIYISINHLGDLIVEHLGDGSRLGCEVEYLREDPAEPLGTAGSLSLLHAERPDIDLPVLVMNGDLMVQFEPRGLLGFHAARGADVTVGIRPYQHEVPFGVVDVDHDGHVAGISEKPAISMLVNAGVYVISPAVLAQVPPATPCTMPEVIDRCLLGGGKVTAWELSTDWIDVGTPADLARAKGDT